MTIHRLGDRSTLPPPAVAPLSSRDVALVMQLLDRALVQAEPSMPDGPAAPTSRPTAAERAALRRPLRLNPSAIGTPTLSDAEIEAVKAHNDAAGDALDVVGGDLTEQVQVNLLQERQRVEVEKYEFSGEERSQAADVAPEAERKRLENNVKHREKLNELKAERHKIANDPELSPEDRQKKLEKIDEKIAERARRIRPPFSLENLTAMTDQIINDPTLSEKDKKKQIDEIRKDYGMKKRGKGSFSKLVAHRLGDIYKDSKKRVDEFGKKVDKAGKEKLKELEETYGKDSVQAKTFKADLEGAKKAREIESQTLDAKQGTLRSMYPGFWKRVGNFFKGALKVFGKITDFVALPLKFIPGVGSIASAVTSGVGGLAKLATGDWKGAISSFISAVPIPGTKAIGGTVAGAFTKVGGKVTATGAKMAGSQGAKKLASKGLSKGGDWLAKEGPASFVDAAIRMPLKVGWDAGARGRVFGVPIRRDGGASASVPSASPASPTGSFTSLRARLG